MNAATNFSNGRKRHRVPLACSFCRTKKKRCDKKKPACTYCLEHGNANNCVYENVASFHSSINSAHQSLLPQSTAPSSSSSLPAIQGLSNSGFVLTFSEHLPSAGSPDKIQSTGTEWINSTPSVARSCSTNHSPLAISEELCSPALGDDTVKLNVQLAEMRKQIEMLELMLRRKSNKNNSNGATEVLSPPAYQPSLATSQEQLNPVFEENEFIDLFETSFVLIKTNRVSAFKPLHRLSLFHKEQFYEVCLKYINLCYTRIKQILKEGKIKNDFSILMNPLAAQLNENFKFIKLSFMIHLALNRSNSKLQINTKLLAALCSSKKNGFSSLRFDNELAETSEMSRVALVAEIKRYIPKRPSEIGLLWSVFEKYVYPFAPFLDLKSFKRDLELILVGLKVGWSDDDALDERDLVEYEINLTSFIDLAIIATFLIILRLSYISLKVNIELLTPTDEVERRIVNVDNLNYIGSEVIALAFSCLSQCKSLTKPSLSVFHAYMYMYHYYAHSEENVESFDDNERVNLAGIISSIAHGIGLFKDWESVYVHCEGKSHPGCDYYDLNSLYYITRKSWHTFLRYNVEEFVTTGFALDKRANGHVVKLPSRPVANEDNASCGSDFLTDRIVDMNYERQQQVNLIVSKVEGLFYNAHIAKVADLFDCYSAIGNYLSRVYNNAEKFFENSANFEVRINSRVGSIYHLTLNKVLHMEQYILLQMLKFKLSVVLLYYYQDKQDQSKYFYFLKLLMRTLAVIAKVYVRGYLINNQVFLNVEQDINLKNFNYKMLPISGKFMLDLVFLLQALIFQSFSSVFSVQKSIKEGGLDKDINALRDQLQHLISFKKLLMKFLETFVKAHYYKSVLFYFNYIKFSNLLSIVLSEFKYCDTLNDKGEEIELFNVAFFSKQNGPYTKEREILGLKCELKEVAENPAFSNLATYQIKKLMDILLLDGSSYGFGEAVEAMNYEGTYIDEMLGVVRSSSLYDAFPDEVSFTKLMDQIESKTQ